ncbi:MAG: lamin tail domain-containing protein, partial [Planctomycetota bacterium]
MAVQESKAPHSDAAAYDAQDAVDDHYFAADETAYTRPYVPQRQGGEAGSRAGRACGGTVITQNSSQSIVPDNSIACTSAGPPPFGENNAYARCFPASFFTQANDISCVEIGIQSANHDAEDPPYTCTLNLSFITDCAQMTSNGWGTLTPVHSQTVDVPPGFGPAILTVELTSTVIVPPATNVVVEFFTPTRNENEGALHIGSNTRIQGGLTYMWSSDCGINTYTDADIIQPGTMMHWVLNLLAGQPTICGDGLLEGAEECETGDPPGVACAFTDCFPPGHPQECRCQAPPPVKINEYQYDDSGTDDREFVELYNAGVDPEDISGWTLRASDTTPPPGDDNADYTIPGVPDSGTTVLAAGDYYVLGTALVPNVDQEVGVNDLWEDSNEALELLDGIGIAVDTFVSE